MPELLRDSTTILLINPSYGSSDYMSTYSVPLLGIGYVGAYLKSLGHEVKFVDIFNSRIKEEDLEATIKTFRPNYVGVGGITAQYPSATKIFQCVKAVDDSIITVYGGPHATAIPEYIMSHNPSLDFIIRGEGEYTFAELISNKDYSQISGLVYREEGEIRVNQPRNYIEDLDSMPFPWGVINPLDYQKGNVHSGVYKRLPTAPVLTTRGCPYKCTYCAGRVICGTKIRARSASNVADEISFLIENFGINEIKIVDDNFTFDYEHATSVCREILARNLEIAWACPNGIRADKVDRDLLKLMKRCGCYYLAFGIEFGSDRIQRLSRRSLNKDKLVQTVRTANELGYFTHGFMLMAHPEEKVEDLEMTRALVRRVPVHRISLGKVVPLPGTELFDYYLEHKFLDLDNMDWSLTNFEFKSKYLTRKDIDRWYNKIIIAFYLRPTKIYNVLSNIRNLHQVKLYFYLARDLVRHFLFSWL